MKNFNNDEIEKAEKMGKKIFGTMPRISYSFNSKKILKGIGLLGIVYGLYTNYRCKSYEKKNYVDAFTLKKEVSSQVRMYDLWNKIMKFDFSSDKFATNRYYEIL